MQSAVGGVVLQSEVVSVHGIECVTVVTDWRMVSHLMAKLDIFVCIAFIVTLTTCNLMYC